MFNTKAAELFILMSSKGNTAPGANLKEQSRGERRSMASQETTHKTGAEPAIRSEPVSFEVEETRIVGELFLPAGYEPGSRGALPGVVCTGTWTSVRQQMTDRYAEKLAAEGLAALSFDYRTYGESGGEPRQIESARTKVRDILAATEFLGTRDEVDAGRIGGMAICASVMYMALAIAQGAPLKALATSAAWIHGPQTVGLMYGGDEGLRERITKGLAAREKFRRTGEVDYVPAESPDDPEAAMVGVEFYENPERGFIPEWTNRFAVMQWPEWLTLDGLAPARAIGVPTMMIHSDGAALPDNVRRFHAALSGPKTLVWMEGEHTQFYDHEPLITCAARAAAGHLRTALGGPST
ncbi:MAG TPA: alpha/beta hydrolase [Rubrobacteraceae bacterium]|jgi:fermentation-respiration switch protein FrsA (DUF1100 family)|nr:alpha/beta hydrolase [Rubrobacteraceae bacterium]